MSYYKNVNYKFAVFGCNFAHEICIYFRELFWIIHQVNVLNSENCAKMHVLEN